MAERLTTVAVDAAAAVAAVVVGVVAVAGGADDDDGDAAVGDHDDGAGDAHHRELTIFLKITVFVIKKMRYNRKMTTEKDILKALRSGEIQLPPLDIRLLEVEPREDSDATIEILWDRRRWKFIVEVKANSSPKAFEAAFSAAQSAATKAKRKPHACPA